MLAQRSYEFSGSRRPDVVFATLSEILEDLRRIWTALKDRLSPPEPVPVRVRGR